MLLSYSAAIIILFLKKFFFTFSISVDFLPILCLLFLHLPAFSSNTFCLPVFIFPSIAAFFFFCLILALLYCFLSHDFDLFLFSLLVSLPHFLSLSLSVCLSPKALSGGAAVEGGGSESSGLAEAPCCSQPPPIANQCHPFSSGRAPQTGGSISY